MKYNRNTFNLLISFILLMGVCVISCKQSNQKSSFSAENRQNLPTDFMDFYEKFHRDSQFQLTHILFPLKSPDLDRSTVDNPVEKIWTPENWVLHQAFAEDDAAFTRKFQLLDEFLITEYILLNAGGYAIERRFAFMGAEWMLIYYSERNTILKPDETDSSDPEEYQGGLPVDTDL
jgi:hypothetical protein